MRASYSSANSNSKPAYLSSLATLASQQYTNLNAAYNADSLTDVVKSTKSTLTTDTTETVNVAKPDSSINVTHGSQQMTYTDYGYRIPNIEANAQNLRAQISLIDEYFAQYMGGQTLPHLDEVFDNERFIIDNDIKRLQVAYTNTILLPPITGTVTGLYKHVGDTVRPGETVARNEDNTSVNLVGILVWPGMLTIGTAVTVETNLFGLTSSTTITGKIIACRGDESGSDRWNVVITCANTDVNRQTVVPLGYRFNYGDTSISFS